MRSWAGVTQWWQSHYWNSIKVLIIATHDDVIKWKHFPRYWPFVQGIQRSPVNSPHKGQWRGALVFSLICATINGWVNNREGGELWRHCSDSVAELDRNWTYYGIARKVHQLRFSFAFLQRNVIQNVLHVCQRKTWKLWNKIVSFKLLVNKLITKFKSMCFIEHSRSKRINFINLHWYQTWRNISSSIKHSDYIEPIKAHEYPVANADLYVWQTYWGWI